MYVLFIFSAVAFIVWSRSLVFENCCLLMTSWNQGERQDILSNAKQTSQRGKLRHPFTFLQPIPTGHTTLLRRWINVIDVDHESILRIAMPKRQLLLLSFLAYLATLLLYKCGGIYTT